VFVLNGEKGIMKAFFVGLWILKVWKSARLGASGALYAILLKKMDELFL